jgi:folate-binding protein YgfZ
LAAARLRELGVIDSDLPQFGHSQARLGKCEVHVRRVDWLDFPGFLVCMPRKGLARCWRDLVDGGVSPAGVAVFHAQRILAGFPLYGIDITEDNLAQEAARTDQAINFKKGCYLGQEPIARIDALGHVNRELRTIRLESTHVPSPGSEVRDESSQNIGHVTSYAMLPDEHEAIALAYLHRKSLSPGTKLLVDCEGDFVPGKVL